MFAKVAPHYFRPMRSWFNRGRCRECYLHERSHPVAFTTAMRPRRDWSLPVDGYPARMPKAGV